MATKELSETIKKLIVAGCQSAFPDAENEIVAVDLTIISITRNAAVSDLSEDEIYKTGRDIHLLRKLKNDLNFERVKRYMFYNRRN